MINRYRPVRHTDVDQSEGWQCWVRYVSGDMVAGRSEGDETKSTMRSYRSSRTRHIRHEDRRERGMTAVCTVGIVYGGNRSPARVNMPERKGMRGCT